MFSELDRWRENKDNRCDEKLGGWCDMRGYQQGVLSEGINRVC